MKELVPNRWEEKFLNYRNDEIYSTLAEAGGVGSNMHAGKQTIRRFNSLKSSF